MNLIPVTIISLHVSMCDEGLNRKEGSSYNYNYIYNRYNACQSTVLSALVESSPEQTKSGLF